MKHIYPLFLAALLSMVLAACHPSPQTEIPKTTQAAVVSQFQLGELVLTIAQDPSQTRIPGFSLDGTTPPLGDLAGIYYSFVMYPDRFSVDLSQFPQIYQGISLVEISKHLQESNVTSYIILYLSNRDDEIPDENGVFDIYSTPVYNTFIMVDERETAFTAKVAKSMAEATSFSYIHVIGDALFDYVKESFADAVMWVRAEETQEALLEEIKDCQPGVHWSCATFHVVDEYNNGIAGAQVSIQLGTFGSGHKTDAWGKLTVPLNSDSNSPSSGEMRKFHEYHVKVWADGYGMWDGENCKVFSAPYESKTYTIVLPTSGVTSCSSLVEENSEGNVQPAVVRVIPDNFYFTMAEYIEVWEWGVLSSACVMERRFELAQMLDEKTALVRVTSRLREAIKGDCGEMGYDDSDIKVDVFSGAAVDSPNSTSLFAGAQAQPTGSSASSFNNVGVWVTNDEEDLSWDDGYTYHYSYENYLDQSSGLRIYRLINGMRMKDGVRDEAYCRWQQTQAVETNAPIGGNPSGYASDYPLMKSGCAYMERAVETPPGDPCIVMRNYYDWMNEENLELFFQNFTTEGWSGERRQKEVDWQQWYFSEYDVRYTVNSCNVTWKSVIPPFSAILSGSVHSESLYKGNQSQTDLDVKMAAVYRNGDWFAARWFSVEDANPVTVPFVNLTDGVVEVFWIDYEKNERSWFELQPGEEREIDTALTHVWAIYDKESGERLLYPIIFPNQQPIVIWQP